MSYREIGEFLHLKHFIQRKANDSDGYTTTEHVSVSKARHVTFWWGVVLVSWCQNVNSMTRRTKNKLFLQPHQSAVDSWISSFLFCSQLPFFFKTTWICKAARTHKCAFTNWCESVRDNTGLVLNVLSCGQFLLRDLYFYIWLQPWNGHPTLSLFFSRHLIKTHFCEWNYLESIQRSAHVVSGASLPSLPGFIWSGRAPVLRNIGLKLFIHYRGCHRLN